MAYTTINNPHQFFQSVLWTAYGTNPRTITFGGSVDIQPDLLWYKCRSAAVPNILNDSVRGFGNDKELSSNDATAAGGQSSETDGYVSGGTGSPVGPQIDKFSFSSDGNAVDWADLSFSRSGWCGVTSSTHGYHAGGWYNGPMSNVIDKFPFATQTNASDVGNFLIAKNQDAGACSLTHGYSMGGYYPGNSNVIEIWSFSSNGNSTDVGDLTQARYCLASCSSTTHGFAAGGDSGSGGTPHNIIDKVSFASGGNATDVGDMSHTGNYMGLGSQY